MSNELKEHVRSTGTWKRGLFILLFTVIYSIAEVVLGTIVLFQFGSQLFTGKTNDKLYQFSRGLTAYFYQLVQFLTYRSDIKPYPFNEWPGEGLESVQQLESEVQPAAQQAGVKKQPAKRAKTTKPTKTTKTTKPTESTEPKPAEPSKSAEPGEDVTEKKE